MKKFAVQSGAALLAVMVLTGCGKKEATGGAESSDAGVSVGAGMVEGADLVIRADLKGLRESALYAASRKEKSAEDKAIQEAIVEATGLAEEDFEAMLFAVELDAIDFDAEDMAAEVEKVDGVLAIGLKKAVDLDTVVAGLQSVSTNDTMSFETIKAEGRDVVVATSEDDEAPKMYATTAQDGKLVLVSINSPSLLAAAKRADGGKHHPTPKAITKVCAAWNQKAQMVAGFVLSNKMKKDLTAHIEAMEKDEKQAMMVGMIAPFKKLQTLAMAIESSDVMDVTLIMDLGDSGNANQALGTVNGMVMPMVKMAMAKSSNADSAEKFSVKVVDSSLTINVKMTAEDLKNSSSADPVEK